MTIRVLVLISLEQVLVQTVMGAHLKPHVTHERHQQQDRCAAADLECAVFEIRGFGIVRKGLVEDCWHNQTQTGYEEQTRSDLRHGVVKFLLVTFEATKEEAETETEKEVGQDGTEDGGFDNGDWVDAVVALRYEEYDEDDQLNEGAESHFEDDAENFGQFAREFLAAEAEKVGCGNHGDVVQDEDPQIEVWTGKMLVESMLYQPSVRSD